VREDTLDKAFGRLYPGPNPAGAMDEETDPIELRLATLRQEHRDLDAAIAALESAGSSDLLQIKRLKKRKLQLKDAIRTLAAQSLPDIIA